MGKMSMLRAISTIKACVNTFYSRALIINIPQNGRELQDIRHKEQKVRIIGLPLHTGLRSMTLVQFVSE